MTLRKGLLAKVMMLTTSENDPEHWRPSRKAKRRLTGPMIDDEADPTPGKNGWPGMTRC